MPSLVCDLWIIVVRLAELGNHRESFTSQALSKYTPEHETGRGGQLQPSDQLPTTVFSSWRYSQRLRNWLVFRRC